MIIEYQDIKVKTGYLLKFQQTTWSLEEAKTHINWVEKVTIPICIVSGFRNLQEQVKRGAASNSTLNELFVNSLDDARLMLKRLGNAVVYPWNGPKTFAAIDINAYEENTVR